MSPLVEFERPDLCLLTSKQSPKFVTLPVDAIVMNSIVFVTGSPPAKIPRVLDAVHTSSGTR